MAAFLTCISEVWTSNLFTSPVILRPDALCALKTVFTLFLCVSFPQTFIFQQKRLRRGFLQGDLPYEGVVLRGGYSTCSLKSSVTLPQSCYIQRPAESCAICLFVWLSLSQRSSSSKINLTERSFPRSTDCT